MCRVAGCPHGRVFRTGVRPTPLVACLDVVQQLDHHSRGPRAQPQGRHGPHAAGQARDDHGAVGVGQVEPRVRHPLRRGPAALRRVALGLRAAVPGADGEARRRRHRGPVAGHLDRPEDDLPQPALDRRHRHRGVRLPAPALRAHRAPALPRSAAGRSPGQSAEQIVEQVMQLPEGTRFTVDAPVARGKKGEFKDVLETLRGEGFTRARVDGEMRLLEEPIALDKKFKHDIAVVVDRLVMKDDLRRRLTDSVETALTRGRRPGGDPGRAARGRGRAAAAGLLRALRLPGARRVAGRARAARVLLQLAARRVPALPRPRARCPSSTRT